MQYKDYYRILGVGRQATQAEIRKAYKELAMRYHPDQNPDDPKAEARFKEVNEAHEVLGNPENRRKYDLLGAQYQRFQGAGGFGQGGFSGASQPELNNLFTSFFEEIFNKNKKRSRNRGKDKRFNISISLKEAYTGTQGIWRVEGQRLKINMKPGISDGQVLRLKGKGANGRNGAEPGDMLIKVSVASHPHFDRKGDDLYTELPIDLYTAVLGKRVAIETLKGKMSIAIPPGTQSGERLKLGGLGMPNYQQASRLGNLYLTVRVRIPKRLSEQEKSLFQQLDHLKHPKKGRSAS